jgi:hypothetical protein
MRIPFISLITASAIALGGCAYGGVGLGYGDPYSSYGYGGGYGSYGGYGSGYGNYGGYGYNSGYGGYGNPYGYGAGYGYGSGFGYGSPYFGWYDGFYYPGTGYYVYDTYRRPRAWSDAQRRYWMDRHKRASSQGIKPVTSSNWGGFERPRQTTGTRNVQTNARDRVAVARAAADQRRSERATTRASERSERATRSQRSSSSDDRRSRRRPN